MKRLLIALIVILSVFKLSAQNEYKYVLYLYGGMRVGPEDRITYMAEIDSIKINAGTLTFYDGGVSYSTGAGGAGDLLADGTIPLTANWDVGSYNITASRFISDVAVGTAPFGVSSTTVVVNLNADLLDDQSGFYYLDNANHTGDVTGSAALTIAVDAVDIPMLSASGTASSTTYLRGDNTWATPSAGGSSVITDLTATAWRVFYSNTSGDVTELALGADGTYLKSNGASAAPTFAVPTGSGDMLSTNNLSELTSDPTARSNIDVYSTSETEEIAGDSAQAVIDNGVALETKVWMLDSTFVLGAFSAVDSFNTSFIYGSFYNNGSDTLIVTEMGVSCLGTTVSFTVDVEWHSILDNASATHLNTTPPTITDESGAITSDVTFDNAVIPPGVQVWVKTPTVTTSPTYMSVTLLGHRQNNSN